MKYLVTYFFLFGNPLGFLDMPAADAVGTSVDYGIAFVRLCGSVVFTSGTEIFDIFVNWILAVRFFSTSWINHLEISDLLLEIMQQIQFSLRLEYRNA